MAQTLTSLLVHLIFSTKNRQPLIAAEHRDSLYAYMGGIAANHDCRTLVSGGMDDHVHLLISLSKTIALADLVMDVKKDSSKWLKTQSASFTDFHWQDGYAAFTIGQSQVPDLTCYIRNQEQHHQHRSFQDELRVFLRKYEIAFDERYIWG